MDVQFNNINIRFHNIDSPEKAYSLLSEAIQRLKDQHPISWASDTYDVFNGNEEPEIEGLDTVPLSATHVAKSMQAEISDPLASLIERVEQRIENDDFAEEICDLVANVATRMAANLNNSSFEKQIRFLAEQIGVDEIERTLGLSVASE